MDFMWRQKWLKSRTTELRKLSSLAAGHPPSAPRMEFRNASSCPRSDRAVPLVEHDVRLARTRGRSTSGNGRPASELLGPSGVDLSRPRQAQVGQDRSLGFAGWLAALDSKAEFDVQYGVGALPTRTGRGNSRRTCAFFCKQSGRRAAHAAIATGYQRQLMLKPHMRLQDIGIVPLSKRATRIDQG
jgi:hypothetical protein